MEKITQIRNLSHGQQIEYIKKSILPILIEDISFDEKRLKSIAFFNKYFEGFQTIPQDYGRVYYDYDRRAIILVKRSDTKKIGTFPYGSGIRIIYGYLPITDMLVMRECIYPIDLSKQNIESRIEEIQRVALSSLVCEHCFWGVRVLFPELYEERYKLQKESSLVIEQTIKKELSCKSPCHSSTKQITNSDRKLSYKAT